MDSTLTSDNIRASDRERRVFRARFVVGYFLSYTIDTVLLGLFATAGTIPFWIPIAYFATGSSISAVFGSFMLFGISERRKDPYFTSLQTFVSGACMLVFLALAPNVGFLFLCTLFIVFGFSSLRMSWRDALLLFGLIALGTGSVLYYTSGVALLPYSTPLERLLVWIAFVVILARLIVLGLVGSGLRIRVVKAYQNLKALTSELENRTSELVKANAAADAANRAKLESERKLAEQALRESDERFRQLAETMADAVLVGQDGRNVYANLAAARLLGAAAPEELVGTDMFAIIEHAQHERARLQMQRMLAGEKLSPFEDRFIRFDGSVVLVEIAASSLTWQGRPALQAVVRDITERKRAEDALRQSEERYRVLAEASNDMITLINCRHEVEYTNSFAARQFGCSPQDLIGKRLADIFPPEIVAHQKLNLKKVFESGESLYVEAPVIFLGNSLWLGSWLVPVKDPCGEITGILIASREITERKQVEQKLRDSLAEKEVLMREIHHRVKNNLQMISALLELQSGDVKDEQALAYFKESQQRIQSMAMIHAQLYQNQDLAQIDFGVYLQSLVDHLRGQYSESCARVDIRVDAEACTLPVDTAVPLGLAVNELVSNAMKHAFPRGRTGALRIGLQGDGGKVVLEVADDGVGLPAGLEMHGNQSFGLRLLTLMVEQQLHGKLTVKSDQGTRVVCEIGTQK